MQKFVPWVALAVFIIVASGCTMRRTATLPPATPTPLPSAGPTPSVAPVPASASDWQTYANDMYHYQFSYPPGAIITEAQRQSFSISSASRKDGLTTVDEVYQKYTGKVCLKVAYRTGYVLISAPANRDDDKTFCRRIRVGMEPRSEAVTVEGKRYLAFGDEGRRRDPEGKGREEALWLHDESLAFTLDDGTRIEYGAKADGVTYFNHSSTYADYLLVKPELMQIMASYRSGN